jgi:hypothetical protein
MRPNPHIPQVTTDDLLGQLNFTAVADHDTYPDLEVFTQGVQSALDELARSVLTPAPLGRRH